MLPASTAHSPSTPAISTRARTATTGFPASTGHCPVEVDIPQLVVHDLFAAALRLEFIPLFDAATISRVFIDVEYRDPDNGYERSERLELRGDATDPVKLRIALRDGTLRRYRRRLTFVGTAGTFDQRAWEESEEELVPVR